MNTPEANPLLPRRNFLKTIGLGATAAVLSPKFLRAEAASATSPAAPKARSDYQIAFLEKWFFDGSDGKPHRYTPAQMAQTCDEMGLDLELTVRKNGHMTPEQVPDELPLMVEAMAAKNRKVLFIAMDTVRVDEPYWEAAARTAQKLGIKQYRHRGFKYEGSRPLKVQIADFNHMAKDFAAANKEIGIQALYQTHAGASMAGSAGWDLDLILDGVDPHDFGVAWDTRHMGVELGMSWSNSIKLLAPRIAVLCV